MRVLILNQPFHPDVVATGQYASDLARALAARGHEVTVICSARAYDDPARRFSKRETWNGVKIIRVLGTGLGKSAKWKRAADFATFMLGAAAKALTLPKQHVVIAMTTPPLVSVLGALMKPWKAARLLYWTMDLNPDEAIAAKYIAPASHTAKLLHSLQNYSLRKSDAIVALDEFMKKRIVSKDIPPERVSVIPPWSLDSNVRYDRAAADAFRAKHGLNDKFVVMYAGNHSPCHPLDTMMKVAKAMRLRDDLAFVFLGGGSEQTRIATYARSNQLKNVKCLPYEPREGLCGALSAADLHLVVMGEPFVGMIHPCKIYNILAVGSPFLYIGPGPSHVTELMRILPRTEDYAYWVRTGDAAAALECILAAQRTGRRLPAQNASFSADALLPHMISIVEGLASPEPSQVAKDVPA